MANGYYNPQTGVTVAPQNITATSVLTPSYSYFNQSVPVPSSQQKQSVASSAPETQEPKAIESTVQPITPEAQQEYVRQRETRVMEKLGITETAQSIIAREGQISPETEQFLITNWAISSSDTSKQGLEDYKRIALFYQEGLGTQPKPKDTEYFIGSTKIASYVGGSFSYAPGGKETLQKTYPAASKLLDVLPLEKQQSFIASGDISRVEGDIGITELVRNLAIQKVEVIPSESELAKMELNAVQGPTTPAEAVKAANAAATEGLAGYKPPVLIQYVEEPPKVDTWTGLFEPLKQTSKDLFGGVPPVKGFVDWYVIGGLETGESIVSSAVQLGPPGIALSQLGVKVPAQEAIKEVGPYEFSKRVFTTTPEVLGAFGSDIWGTGQSALKGDTYAMGKAVGIGAMVGTGLKAGEGVPKLSLAKTRAGINSVVFGTKTKVSQVLGTPPPEVPEFKLETGLVTNLNDVGIGVRKTGVYRVEFPVKQIETEGGGLLNQYAIKTKVPATQAEPFGSPLKLISKEKTQLAVEFPKVGLVTNIARTPKTETVVQHISGEILEVGGKKHVKTWIEESPALTNEVIKDVTAKASYARFATEGEVGAKQTGGLEITPMGERQTVVIQRGTGKDVFPAVQELHKKTQPGPGGLATELKSGLPTSFKELTDLKVRYYPEEPTKFFYLEGGKRKMVKETYFSTRVRYEPEVTIELGKEHLRAKAPPEVDLSLVPKRAFSINLVPDTQLRAFNFLEQSIPQRRMTEGIRSLISGYREKRILQLQEKSKALGKEYPASQAFFPSQYTKPKYPEGTPVKTQLHEALGVEAVKTKELTISTEEFIASQTPISFPRVVSMPRAIPIGIPRTETPQKRSLEVTPRTAYQPSVTSIERPRQTEKPRSLEIPRIIEWPRITEIPREVERSREIPRPREVERSREIPRPREVERPREIPRPREVTLPPPPIPIPPPTKIPDLLPTPRRNAGTSNRPRLGAFPRFRVPKVKTILQPRLTYREKTLLELKKRMAISSYVPSTPRTRRAYVKADLGAFGYSGLLKRKTKRRGRK